MIRNKKIAQIVFCITLATTSANAFDVGGALSNVGDKFLSSFANGILGKLLGRGNGSSRLNKILEANNLNFCKFDSFNFDLGLNKGRNGICDLAREAKNALSGLCSFIPGMSNGANSPASSALDKLCSMSEKSIKEATEVARGSVYSSIGLSKDAKLNGKTLDQHAKEMTFENISENLLLKNFMIKGNGKVLNFARDFSMGNGASSIKDFKREDAKAPKDIAEYEKAVSAGAEQYRSLAAGSNIANKIGATSAGVRDKQGEEAQKAREEAEKKDLTPEKSFEAQAALRARVLSNIISERPALLTQGDIDNLRDDALKLEAQVKVHNQIQLEAFLRGMLLSKQAKRDELVKLANESTVIANEHYIAGGYQKEDTNALIDTVKQVRGGGLPPELGGTESGGGLLDSVAGAANDGAGKDIAVNNHFSNTGIK